ncbi:MAG: VWA domain-containing protein [Acidobacteria bacterium]|nr:VWA domain-containing protein [Acidobacteriota bacterium]
MTFVHPWFFLGLVAAAAWGAREWTRTARRGGLALKVLMAALVIAALAQPRLSVYEKRVAVNVLADTSASVPQEDLRKESAWIARLSGERGRHALRVIPFSGDTRDLRPEESKGRLELRSEGRSTNLERAIRNAIGALPEGRVPRVLLVSDGRENQGSVERSLHQARLLGIPIDTYPLDGAKPPALRLESLALPAQAFTGEKFHIEAVAASPRASTASVEITAEGKTIGRAQVNLVPGANTLRVRAQLDTEGATPVSGEISSPELGRIRFDRVLSMRRPRLLLISKEPVEANRHLRQVLDSARFDVVESSGALPPELDEFQVVMFVNYDIASWPIERKKKIEDYVREGGGFALVAGEKNIYVENKQEEDPIERMLPAKIAPPRTPEGTAVVLIVDKSSSMEGKKIELARLSAIGVVQNLRPIDQVGVLIFDNSFQWAVPIRKADNPALIKKLISGIMPDGGTQIAPALNEAYRQIRRTKAAYRHIVLLTDGISEEGDSMALAREAAANKVTISTVGLGQDVNRNYLEKVATLASGKSYFLLDVEGLQQLLLRDVMEHTGTSAVEKPVQAAVVRDVEIMEGVGMEKAPPLLGYLKFIAKPQAETILRVDGKEPLLTRWQYGLGRAAVFASDVKARWAANWIGWPGYDRLWANLLRDLLPRAPTTEATAELDSANNEIVVRYRLQASRVTGPESAAPAELLIVGPENLRKAVPLKRVAALTYEARATIGNRQGLFRFRPAGDWAKFPEVGFYREETELTEYGCNAELLRQIAESTGGRFNPTPRQVFDAGNRAVTTTLELWPGLLALALLANLGELAARKGYIPWLAGRSRR